MAFLIIKKTAKLIVKKLSKLVVYKVDLDVPPAPPT
jgi:hypothetical protein